jgi:hypothetical protein
LKAAEHLEVFRTRGPRKKSHTNQKSSALLTFSARFLVLVDKDVV